MKNRKRYLQYKARLKQIKKYGNFYDEICPKCGNKGLFFYDRYDAECCLACDTWLENACNDKNCPFCAKLSTDRMRVRNENGSTQVRYTLDNPPMERNEIDCKITAKK